MSLVRLLELMKGYDFSQRSKYTGRNPHAFMQLFDAIRTNAYNILHVPLEEDQKEQAKIGMYMAYGYVRTRYDSIDFERLEKEIEAGNDRYYVATLFETRDLLPKLGRTINRFMQNPHEETYSEIARVVSELHKADEPPYRNRIKELEQRLKAEPAPSQKQG
jgi:hypothetical protein